MVCCSVTVWTCRGSVTAAQSKSALAAVFDVAPNCVDAKLLQAETMLDERDYGGMRWDTTQLDLATVAILVNMKAYLDCTRSGSPMAQLACQHSDSVHKHHSCNVHIETPSQHASCGSFYDVF